MKLPQDSTSSAVVTTWGEVMRWGGSLLQVHARLASYFARPQPYQRLLRFLQGIVSQVERKNGWQLAEQARETTPYGMQRLLSQAVWDEDGVRDEVRAFALSQLGTSEAIVAIDETSFRKRRKHSAGVQKLSRLHQAGVPVGWVVADSVYGGHLELRTWLESHQYAYVGAVACDEPVVLQTPLGVRRVEVRDVPALVLTDASWQRLALSEGTKGPRLFDWACVPVLHRGQDDGWHSFLIPPTLNATPQLPYYLVFHPPATSLLAKITALGGRWRIEEDFEWGKDLGLDQYEVRSFVGWYRHYSEWTLPPI